VLSCKITYSELPLLWVSVGNFRVMDLFDIITYFFRS